LGTTYSSTDSVLKTLIGFVIKRGVLVTVVQIALLTVFYACSSRMYWYVEPEDVYSPQSMLMMSTE